MTEVPVFRLSNCLGKQGTPSAEVSSAMSFELASAPLWALRCPEGFEPTSLSRMQLTSPEAARLSNCLLSRATARKMQRI